MLPFLLKPERIPVIYSLGTSHRSFGEFVHLLREHGIEVAVDIRSFPTSRFLHFSKAVLSRNLESEGIRYIHLGEELGGFRKGGYLSYRTSEAFQKGMDRLEGIGREKRTAFFCAEKYPWRCHRRWVAQELVRRGWRVIHLLEPGKTWEPGPQEDRGRG